MTCPNYGGTAQYQDDRSPAAESNEREKLRIEFDTQCWETLARLEALSVPRCEITLDKTSGASSRVAEGWTGDISVLGPASNRVRAALLRDGTVWSIAASQFKPRAELALRLGESECLARGEVTVEALEDFLERLGQ